MKNKLLIFVFGGFFMTAMSYLAFPLPFSPIQLSLQSLGVSVLSILFLNHAWYGVLGYLTLACLGMPVLAGGDVNNLWLLSPKAGYYIGFLLASIIVGNVLKRIKPAKFITSWLCLALNESTILFAGWLVLSFYLSPQKAWVLGVLPFLPGAIVKITIATIFWCKGRTCLSKLKL